MKTPIPINEKRAKLGGTGSLLQSTNLIRGSSLGYIDNSTNYPKVSSTNFTAIGTQREHAKHSLLVDTTVRVSNYRKERFSLLLTIKRILQNMNFRVSDCMKALGYVDAIHNGKGGRSHNHILCGSIWLCPICSSRITEQRREELDRAVKNNPGLLPVLVTLTLQHSKDDKLTPLLDTLNTTLQKMKQGYSWKKFQSTYGVKAYASSLEVTFSLANGWHPHKHLLFFVDKDTDLQGFERDITERYLKILDKNGGYGSEFHAVTCRSGTASAATYASKWGITTEFAKSNLKKGRGESYSMWELAMLAETEPLFFVKYQEYANATYRRKAITWSKNAHDILNIGEELTDEQVSQIEETSPDEYVVAKLAPKLWNTLLYSGLVSDVLEIADTGGIEPLWEFLKALRYPIYRKDTVIEWIT